MKNKTETLDEWLISQIKRGCTLESMTATMQEGGYALTIAQNYVVNAFVAAGKLMPSDLNQPIQNLSAYNHLMISPAKQIKPDPSLTLNKQEQQAQLAWLAMRKKCNATTN